MQQGDFVKIKSDKNWQEQKEILRRSLDEDTLGVYNQVIEKVTGHAEERLVDSEVTSDLVIELVREGFDKVVNDDGFLIPDVLSSILVVLIIHWEYGQQLSDGLSSIEFSLVAEEMVAHIERKRQEAAEASQQETL